MASPIDPRSVFIKMVVSAWDTQNTRLQAMLGKLSNADLARETAPGRNTGIYLLGHLVAIMDAMIPLLGWGDRKYAHLDEAFVKHPDKSGLEMPLPDELRNLFTEVTSRLSQHIAGMSADDWFQRHSAVSAADFEKEPHRNRLNILVNRRNHHSYHIGQLAYLVPRSA